VPFGFPSGEPVEDSEEQEDADNYARSWSDSLSRVFVERRIVPGLNEVRIYGDNWKADRDVDHHDDEGDTDGL
jgi:hypothetical protein